MAENINQQLNLIPNEESRLDQLEQRFIELEQRFRRHRHEGIETDSLSAVDLATDVTGTLPVTNGGTGDTKYRIYIPASAMTHDISGFMALTQGGPASLWVYGNFANSAVTRGQVNIKIPVGATAIDAIKLHYDAVSGSATNLYLKFQSSIFGANDGDGATTDTGPGYSTYAGSGTSDKHGIITVPSSAYDGLTIAEQAILNLFIQRDATHASDTYEDEFKLLGVEFIFT